jgi:5'-methylthioadenosine phosphorylase
MAHVTDYDVWHLSEQPVTVELVIQTLRKNTSIAEQAVRGLARTWSADRNCDCARALEHALITDPAKVPVATLEKLGALLPKRPIQP